MEPLRAPLGATGGATLRAPLEEPIGAPFGPEHPLVTNFSLVSPNALAYCAPEETFTAHNPERFYLLLLQNRQVIAENVLQYGASVIKSHKTIYSSNFNFCTVSWLVYTYS